MRATVHSCAEVELVVTVAGQVVLRCSLEHLTYAGKYAGPLDLLEGFAVGYVEDEVRQVVRAVVQHIPPT